MIGDEITDEHIERAATLFSNHYGLWKTGSRVRMSSSKLRSTILPSDPRATNLTAHIFYNDTLIGNVFACRWEHKGRPICWITQLVVHKDFRGTGKATFMLEMIRDRCPEDTVFGIPSSHPFAILAALRAFGRGAENFHWPGLSIMEKRARSILASSPVEYVRNAEVHGSLFRRDGDLGGGSWVPVCADTGFFVDHTETDWALGVLERGKKREYVLGKLPEGHEFLVVVDRKSQEEHYRYRYGNNGIEQRLSDAVLEVNNGTVNQG